MTDRLSHALESIENIMLTLRSAARATGAVNVHRMPAAADLARLGIDAEAFKDICRH